MTRSLVILALVAATALPAWAHKPSDAQLRLAVTGSTIAGRLDVAIRDLDAALALDADADAAITWRELDAAAPRIAAYVTDRLALAGDGAACPVALGPAGIAELSDGAYWALPITATCPHDPATLAIRYRLLFDVDAQHRGLLQVDGVAAIATSAEPVRIALGEASSFGRFIEDGVAHIWGGLDHCLFLLCLILPAVFQRPGARWQPAESLATVGREVLEIVTAFTLAHSITLVISAIGLVQLPSRLVETAIALSVAAAAINNLVRAVDARWALAFALGLLHGFGFSSVLVDLGLPSHALIGALLGFNLGVELGQAAIVIALLPVLYVARRTLAYQVVLWGGSALTAVIAVAWSYQRWCA